MSWNPPLKSKRHGKITKYLIRYYKDGQSRFDLIYVLGQEHKTTINNLDRGKTYTVQIAAKTSAGPGPFSMKISGTVLSIPNGGKLRTSMILIIMIIMMMMMMMATLKMMSR